PPLPCLGMPHPVIRQIGQANQRRTSHTANNDTLTNLTHNVVSFNAGQLTTLGLLKHLHDKLEQPIKRLRAAATASESLQPSPCRPELGQVPRGNLAGVHEGNKLLQGSCPANLAVLDSDDCGGFLQVLRDFRKLRNILALNREANASATHEDVKGFIESARMVYGQI